MAALRASTRASHRAAERSGIISAILRATATRQGYALFLRNLLPIYQALESRLERSRDVPPLRPFARLELYRSEAIAADLAALDPEGRGDLPLLRAGKAYADRIAAAACDTRLLAHAYVRYFGDMNGGQIVAARLAASLGLMPGALQFYAFPGIPDMGGFEAACRNALNDTVRDPNAIAAACDEANTAFALNISLSEAVQRAADAHCRGEIAAELGPRQ